MAVFRIFGLFLEPTEHLVEPELLIASLVTLPAAPAPASDEPLVAPPAEPLVAPEPAPPPAAPPFQLGNRSSRASAIALKHFLQ